MRVLFAIKSVVVPGGGAEKVLALVANGLVARGHEVAILTFDPPGDSFYPLDPRITRFPLDVGPPGQPTPRGRLLRALPRIRATARRWRPDIAVALMHSTYIPFGAALAGAGIPVVASEHATVAHFTTRPLQRALVRLLDLLFVAKTVPVESGRSALPPAIRRKTSVLHNPLELADFSAVAATPPVDPPVMLFVGRFMEDKNPLELLEAYAQVAGELPDWRLRLVGDGVMRPQIERAVAASPWRDRIELPGATRAVADEYARAAFVVVPSRNEAFGMVTVEAQAAARAVLGFADCPGTNELVSDGVDGLLVAGGEQRVRHFAEGMRRLAGDAALRARLGAAGPAAAARFHHERVVDDWARFLQAHARHRSAAPGTAPW